MCWSFFTCISGPTPLYDILCPTLCPGKLSSSSSKPLALYQPIVWHQDIRGQVEKDFKVFVFPFPCASLKSCWWLTVCLYYYSDNIIPSLWPIRTGGGRNFPLLLSPGWLTILYSHHPACTSLHGYFNKLFSAHAFVSTCFMPGPWLI